MILRNPTKNEITVQINGRSYTVQGQGEISVPNVVGIYWVNNLHGFMQIMSADEQKAETSTTTVEVSEPKEVKTETEEVTAEVTETETKEPEVSAEVTVEKDGTRVRKVEGSRRPRTK